MYNNLKSAHKLLVCKILIIGRDSERFIAFEWRQHQSRRVSVPREATGFDNDSAIVKIGCLCRTKQILKKEDDQINPNIRDRIA